MIHKYFRINRMANVLSFQLGARNRSAYDRRELARKLELIEDRPDGVLTWADVARHVRAAWRRLDTAALRNR